MGKDIGNKTNKNKALLWEISLWFSTTKSQQSLLGVSTARTLVFCMAVRYPHRLVCYTLGPWCWCFLGGCRTFRTWDTSGGSELAGKVACRVIVLTPLLASISGFWSERLSPSHLPPPLWTPLYFPHHGRAKLNLPSRCLSGLFGHSNEKNNPHTWCENPRIPEFYLVLVLIYRIEKVDTS